MHLEVLVEDQAGKKMLDAIVPKIIDQAHTFRVHAYKGIGRIPKGLKATSNPAKRILMDQLPRLLQGYGQAFSKYPKGYLAHVAVVCDLDDRNLKEFTKELRKTLDSCRKKLLRNSVLRLKRARLGCWEIAWQLRLRIQERTRTYCNPMSTIRYAVLGKLWRTPFIRADQQR